jgi:diacylglycerol kinase (ATP)
MEIAVESSRMPHASTGEAVAHDGATHAPIGRDRAVRQGRGVHVVVNPCAGGGRAGRLWPEIRERIRHRFGPGCFEYMTGGPGEATEAVRFAIADGRKTIIVVGGDGTIHEAVNGMFHDGALKDPRLELGIVSCGTGMGFAASLDLPASCAAQLDAICAGGVRSIDVGRVRCQDAQGGPVERLWINECQAGIGGTVVARVGPRHKVLGGTLAFGTVAVAELLRGRCYPMELRFDDCRDVHGPLVGVVVGNGRLCGGGMMLTPRAELDDGLLDVVLIHRANPITLLRTFSKIYRGEHARMPIISSYRGRRLTMRSTTRTPIEADGELLGGLPAEIDVLRAALPVRGAGKSTN